MCVLDILGAVGPDSQDTNLSPTLARYQKYLKSYYKNYPVSRDDKLCIAPCSQFIRLALVTKEKAPSQIEMDALVTTDSRFVLVEGPPGIGKSTLCWELCRKWDTLKSLQRFKIVVQLKLRERRVQKAIELSEIFFHRDKKLREAVEGEIFDCEGEGVLLVLDGFDELPNDIVNDESSLIMELIRSECLPKAVCLVTSRPSSSEIKKIFPKDHRYVQILGFSKDNILEYAKSAFESADSGILDHFKTFILSNPNMISIMSIPVNCAIMVKVFEDIRESKNLVPKTMTELYTSLVLVLIKRYMIERKKWNDETRLPDSLAGLPEEVLVDLRKISELAHKGGLSKLVFTEEDVGDNFQHLGLLIKAKEMYVGGTKSFYSFPHFSVQEFIRAWHYACNPELTPNRFFTLMLAAGGMETVMKFLVGFVGCDRIPTNHIEHYSRTIVPLLYEARDSCERFKGFMYHHGLSYIDSYLPTNTIDFYAFGYVLTHAPLQWHLRLGTFFIFVDVAPLVNSLAKTEAVLGSISKLTVKIYWEDSVESLTKLDQLPTCLLQQFNELVFSCHETYLHQPIKWISSLQNLETLSLYQVYPEESDRGLFYQIIGSLPKLKKFSFVFAYPPTVEETAKLSECMASSQTLEYVKLVYRLAAEEEDVSSTDGSDISDASASQTDGSDCDEGYLLLNEFELCRLVEGALSCKTLQMLSTNIPFVVPSSKLSLNLMRIEFKLSPDIWEKSALSTCLSCIAALCERPSIKYLDICHKGEVYPAWDDFLAILNRSLHCNDPFVYLRIEMHLSSNYQRDTFSNTLRTHPSLLSAWNRSKSLPDLPSSVAESEDTAEKVDTDCVFGNARVNRNNIDSVLIGRRHQSCPNVFQMQSLHNIHPLLFKALRCDRLYCKKDRFMRKISSSKANKMLYESL